MTSTPTDTMVNTPNIATNITTDIMPDIMLGTTTDTTASTPATELHHEDTTPHARRRNDTDRKIFKTVLSIATTQGLGAVTIEEVARQSGVAKTTIYRRYTNTDEMLDTISHLKHIDVPQFCMELPKPSRESLQQLCATMETSFIQSIGVQAVGVVLSNQHRFFRNILNAVIQPVVSNLKTYFTEGITTGTFRKDCDIDIIISMIIGSLVAYYARKDLYADEHDCASLWAQRITTQLWPSICAQ